jgi:multidrug resistance protein, MATE family
MNSILSKQYDFLPRFYQLATANVLSNIIIPIGGLITVAFIGHQTEIQHLAGVLLSTILFNFIYNVLAVLRMSTTGLTAQAVGREDREAMLMVGLRNSLIALGLGLMILILQYPLREIGFTVLGGTPEIKASAIAYFNARIWGAPAVLLNFVLIGWFLGCEQSGKVLLLSIVGNTANIVLDYLFIVQWGWESTGAGISQASSQYLMLLLGIILLSLQIQWKELRAVGQQLLELSAYKAIFVLNRDIFVKTLVVITTFVIFNTQSSGMGTIIFAQNALMIQIVFLATYFIEGLGYATETLTGIFTGQEMNEKLIPLVKIAGSNGLLVGLSFALGVVLFPQTVFGLLTDHTEVTESINIYLPWLLPFMVFLSIVYILDGYFIGLAEGYTLRNVALIAVGLGFAPVYVAAWNFHSNHILWLALSSFMVIRAVALGVQLPRTFRSDR